MRVCTKIVGVLFVFALLFISAQAGDEEAVAKFEQPILISSAGQSADMKLIGMLAKRQKLDAKTVNMAQGSDLDGGKTLLVGPGISGRGLGAAGVSQKEEMERVEKLVAAAQEKKIPIVMIHIGGNARRKGQSDAFNQLSAEASVRMIVVKQVDEDGFFSDIAKEKKIPITLVEKIAEVATPLGELF